MKEYIELITWSQCDMPKCLMTRLIYFHKPEASENSL